MDRPIDEGVLKRRAVARWAKVGGAVVALVLALFSVRWLITPDLERDRIRTAVAERGSIEATIAASGTVVPSDEEVVSSPITSRIISVHKYPGDTVKAGELILELDAGQSRLALERTSEQIALKRNENRTRELALRNSLNELEGQLELKLVDLESQKARLARLEKLGEDDLVSTEELLETGLDIRRTEIEIRQKKRAIANARESNQAEIEKNVLETRILERQLAEEQRTYDRASARAPRDGVVTSVIVQTGKSVAVGEELARIADLTSYRVDATLSDSYATRLVEGQPARIKVGDQLLNGSLATILPEIQNGTVQLQVRLDDPRHPSLRASLRAETYLVTERRDDAVNVPRGPGIAGAGTQVVFVVEGDRALRREVEVGMNSYDHWEILSGLDAGETIVLSDMTRYEHMTSVKITN